MGFVITQDSKIPFVGTHCSMGILVGDSSFASLSLGPAWGLTGGTLQSNCIRLSEVGTIAGLLLAQAPQLLCKKTVEPWSHGAHGSLCSLWSNISPTSSYYYLMRKPHRTMKCRALLLIQHTAPTSILHSINLYPELHRFIKLFNLKSCWLQMLPHSWPCSLLWLACIVM
jgi:hypothetical protein